MKWSAGQTFILATITSSHSAHEFLNSVHDVFITGEYGLFLFDDLWGIDIIFCYLIIQQMDALSIGFLH